MITPTWAEVIIGEFPWPIVPSFLIKPPCTLTSFPLPEMPRPGCERRTHWLWDLNGGVLPSTCGLTVASKVTGEAMQDGLEASVVETND